MQYQSGTEQMESEAAAYLVTPLGLHLIFLQRSGYEHPTVLMLASANMC